MTINIEALKASVATIEKLGQSELTFSAGEQNLTIRALKAHEELEVEKFGQIAWDEATGDEDRAALASYLDRMRTGTLSHVIVQIGDLNLRDEEYIETGENDPSGTPIKKPRYLVLRDMIKQWNRHILHLCYLKYAELMQGVELTAGAAIEFDVKDTDTEINRLEGRLDELHKLKKDAASTQSEQTRSTAMREAIKGIGEQGEQRLGNMRHAQELVDDVHRTATQQQAAPQAAPPQQAAPQPQASYPPMRDQGENDQPQMEQPRRSAVPQQGAPPSREAPQQPAQPEQGRDAMGIPRPHEGDSMFDPTDGDAAMHAEHTRLVEHRRQMDQRRAGQQPEPVEIPPEAAPPTGQRPPHRDALNTANATINFDSSEQVQARPKGASQEVQGVRLPTETIAPRDRGQGQPSRGAKAPVNRPQAGSNNPRFKGSQDR